MKESMMINISEQLKSNFDTAKKYAQLGATFITEDPNIVKIIEEAYTLHNSKKDKNGKKDAKKEAEKKLIKLRQHIKNEYKRMIITNHNDYDIVQSHFHIVHENDKSRPISFIRFHRPEKIDFDTKKDFLYFRKMIVDLHQQIDVGKSKPSSGIEVGIAGVGIRGLAPIIINKGISNKEKLIGSFEFGFNHIKIIEDIEKITNTTIRILLDERALENKNIHLDEKIIPAIPGMPYYNSNISTEEHICKKEIKCNDVLTSPIFMEKLKNISKKEKHEYFSVENHDVYLTPFYDMHTESIGVLLIMKEIK